MIRSQIDPNKTMYPEQWVVSLVAKPKGKNPEHAFIVLEGLDKSGETIAYRRYDFVVDAGSLGNVPIQKGKGIVVIKEETIDAAEYDSGAQQRYFWANLLSDLEQIQGCRGASWCINAEEAMKLGDAIKADKKDPPDYQVSGEQALFPASSSQSGHNCYTWARRKLLNIDNDNINHDDRLKVQMRDFLAAQTTKHLNAPKVQDPTSPCLIV